MYQAFDSFLQIDTWHTRHPTDEERFFVALSKVVRNSKFNPDEMGEYMRQKTGSGAARGSHPFELAIDHYVAAAWAVQDYISATGE
jgi:hypothetical protein